MAVRSPWYSFSVYFHTMHPLWTGTNSSYASWLCLSKSSALFHQSLSPIVVPSSYSVSPNRLQPCTFNVKRSLLQHHDNWWNTQRCTPVRHSALRGCHTHIRIGRSSPARADGKRHEISGREGRAVTASHWGVGASPTLR